MKRKLIITIFLFICSSALYAQTEQAESVTSKFYFPALIGVGIPLDNDHTILKHGSILNTAIEFRPVYINAFFFRFNYDALNNSYVSPMINLPTNVVKGKLSATFFLAGAGYRWQFKKIGIYTIMQPGLGMRNFNKAIVTNDGVAIENVTNDSFSVKTSIGFEYYIVKHFALITEPSFYKLFSGRGFNNSHSQVSAISVGITTTLF
ncbi:hypothetical protein SAMN05216490_1085 [Mucilaginibacter mallensis]|uniref:Outer membrane protein beta-barrel domain-containing protein n=1 Tax=Mucilaginibacter mallensis TaxID=652787 RepID=A0A1H1RWP0_MUCMA|nr:hypothetical protein [Mucilaginibacter mallensis]SDS39986.1 hypothetical protein SAMN05216490_1085 [Mucilaginibacter mallensis]